MLRLSILIVIDRKLNWTLSFTPRIRKLNRVKIIALLSRLNLESLTLLFFVLSLVRLVQSIICLNSLPVLAAFLSDRSFIERRVKSSNLQLLRELRNNLQNINEIRANVFNEYTFGGNRNSDCDFCYVKYNDFIFITKTSISEITFVNNSYNSVFMFIS